MKNIRLILILFVSVIIGFSFTNVEAEEFFCYYMPENLELQGVASNYFMIYFSYDTEKSNDFIDIEFDVAYENFHSNLTGNDLTGKIDLQRFYDTKNKKLVCPESLYYETVEFDVNKSKLDINILFNEESSGERERYLLELGNHNDAQLKDQIGPDIENTILATCVYYNSSNIKKASFSIFEKTKLPGNSFIIYDDTCTVVPKNFDTELSECPEKIYLKRNGTNCELRPSRINSNDEELTLGVGGISDGTGQIQTPGEEKIADYATGKGSKIFIRFNKDKDEVRAYLGNNNYILITDSNYVNAFKNKQYNNYPKFILLQENNITFFNSIPDGTDPLSYYYLLAKYQNSKLIPLDLNEIANTCEALFGSGDGGFMGFLKNNVFKIIYITVPIILLVLTTIDFAKVVFNDDKDGIKNAWKRFGKRAIAAVLIYLTPTILIFIADVIGADDVNSCIKAIQNMDK